MKKQLLKPFLINTLRRASYRWGARNECLKAGRIERGFYRCNGCGGTFAKKDISLDHVEPVVSLKGFTNWDDYVNRMFPNIDGTPNPQGFQILCNDVCHKAKTELENSLRVLNRKGLNEIETFIKNKKKKVAKNKKM